MGSPDDHHVRAPIAPRFGIVDVLEDELAVCLDSELTEPEKLQFIATCLAFASL
jgi:hypothetical protein